MDISGLSPVIPSAGRNLKFVNGVCAMSLDSSLRCAAFRMTGKGRCIRNDRIGESFKTNNPLPSSVNRAYLSDLRFCREWRKLIHRRTGTLLQDAMIAAVASTHGLIVVTRNVRDFERLWVEMLNPFVARNENA